jgi:hypothetical protein
MVQDKRGRRAGKASKAEVDHGVSASQAEDATVLTNCQICLIELETEEEYMTGESVIEAHLATKTRNAYDSGHFMIHAC